MVRRAAVAVAIGVCFLAFVPMVVAQLSWAKARVEFATGFQSYTDGDCDAAIQHLKNAAALDPSFAAAHFYLGMAYLQRFRTIPAEQMKQSKDQVPEAVAEFEKALNLDPGEQQRMAVLKGIAAVYFSAAELTKSRDYEQKVIAADPNDVEAYYQIGLIDWIQTYWPRMEARKKLGLSPNSPLTGRVCSQIRAANQNKVNEGIQMLSKAVELSPNYVDAIGRLNLLYRERADIHCGDWAARNADLKKADELVELALAVRKHNAEQPGTPATPPRPPKR